MNAHATLHNAGAPREWHRLQPGPAAAALRALPAAGARHRPGHARRRDHPGSCTTRPSRWPTCSGACGRWTGPTTRAACTPRWSRTPHIATLGTILSVILAVPVGLLAANNLTPSRTINMLARLILVSSRSVNSLVWRCCIAPSRPGALAGTLAIAFRSIGFVGKLVGEAVEEAQRGPIEAVTATGASKSDLVRLLAADPPGVLVHAAALLGHQRARIRRARPGRRRRHRHGAGHRAEPVPVGPRGPGAGLHLRGRGAGRDHARRRANASSDAARPAFLCAARQRAVLPGSAEGQEGPLERARSARPDFRARPGAIICLPLLAWQAIHGIPRFCVGAQGVLPGQRSAAAPQAGTPRPTSQPPNRNWASRSIRP